MTLCKNCSKEFDAKYCPDCGQKASTKRFSTRILFSQLMDKLVPLDRGVLFTTRHLLTRPGEMLRDYLNGKRVGYTKPIQFLLIIAAISLIFFSEDDFQQGMQQGMQVSGSVQQTAVLEFQQKINEFVAAHVTLILLGMIPFLALAGRWFYKKHDVNYAEHFVLSSYLLAGCSIIGMPIMWITRAMGMNVFSPASLALFSVFYVGYFIWAHIGFFRERNRILTGIKAMLTYLIAYLLYIISVGLLSVVAMAVYFAFFKKG